DADAGAIEHARDVDEFLSGGADHARDNCRAARRQLASDRGEVLDTTILQVLRLLEPAAIARLEHDCAAVRRTQLKDFAALRRARARRVHHRRRQLDAAQPNRSPFHPYFVVHAIVRPQAAALSAESATAKFDTVTEKRKLKEAP